VSILFEANRTRTDRNTGSGAILRDGRAEMVSMHASDSGQPKAQAYTPEGILVILIALYLERIKPKLILIQMVLGRD
jgi:hypothetical protein